MSKKNVLITVEGGVGKQVAFTALLPYIKKQYKKIYIVSPYKHIFESNPYVTEVFNFGEDIYQSLVLREDVKVLYKEPYSNERFIKKQCHLLEAWAEELDLGNIDLNSLKPELYLTKKEKEQAKKVYEQMTPFILIQMTGGQSPVSFDENNQAQYNSCEPVKRNYPYYKELVQEIYKKYPDYNIVRYALPNEPMPDELVDIVKTIEPIPFKLYHDIIQKADGVVCIDSSLQHIASSAGKKCVVIWGDTQPEHFGYTLHINLREENLNKTPYFKPLGPSNSHVEFPDVEDVMDSLEEVITPNILHLDTTKIVDEEDNEVELFLAEEQ